MKIVDLYILAVQSILFSADVLAGASNGMNIVSFATLRLKTFDYTKSYILFLKNLSNCIIV